MNTSFARAPPLSIQRANNYNYPYRCSYCLDGRTTVSTFENGTVPIKEVGIGMVLRAYDDVNNTFAKTTITSKQVREVPNYYRVKVNGWVFKMSEDHTLRLVTGQWKQARHLQVGDTLFHLTRSESHRMMEWSPTKQMREEARKRMIEDNPMRDPEVAKKVALSYKRAIDEGRHVPFFRTPEGREFVKTYGKMRAIGDNPMWDMDVVIKNCKAHYKGPSSLEKYVMSLADQYDLPIQYTGDASFWVGRVNPDFVVIGEKKAIEVYDPTFRNRGMNGYAEETIGAYKNAGWSVLMLPLRASGRDMRPKYVNDKDVVATLQKFIHNGKPILDLKRIDAKKEVWDIHCQPHHNYFAEGINHHNC